MCATRLGCHFTLSRKRPLKVLLSGPRRLHALFDPLKPCRISFRALQIGPNLFQHHCDEFGHRYIRLGLSMCSAPGSLDTSLSHAAGLIEIAACHA